MLRTRNNTDGNKLVIFSGIALYYGDTCICVYSGTDDGAYERDDAAFCCTSILGQQRVFSGYASEKCSHGILKQGCCKFTWYGMR